MNRAQRRAATKHKGPRLNPAQKARVTAYARQLYVWRYCENRFWRLTEGWGYRGIVPEALKDEAHNLALVLDLRWQAVSITYLEDAWGKRYKQFGLARTTATFKGYKQGICPLLDETLAEAERGVNPKHIYGRGMVFAPWCEGLNSLLPVLALKREALRLTDDDLAALQLAEVDADALTREIHIPDPLDLDARIARLLEDSR